MKKITDYDPVENNFKSFRSMRNTFEPRKELEEKIFKEIKRRNSMDKKNITLRPITALTAGIIFILIGFSISRLQGVFMNEKNTKTKFMFLVYELGDQNANSSARVEEYTRWITQLHKSNPVASGEKLEESGKIVVAGGVSDITATPVENRISGYFLIEAENYREAISIAKTCPHIKYGGKLEVREIYNLKKTSM